MKFPQLSSLLQSNLLLGAAAVLAGALAAWLGARQLNQRISSVELEVSRRYATAPYIVASRDVSRGQKLDASLLSIRSMPRAFAPADALAPEDASLLIGGRTAVGIRRGTPVVQAAVLPSTAGERLSEHLPDGLRALTIQVDQLNAISGHLEAGDRVDLYYSRTRGTGAVLVPLLQKVRVLATGEVTETQIRSRTAEQLPAEFSSVTLLVTSTDAQRVVLAEQTGNLTLLLRGTADEGLLEPRTFNSSELLKPVQASLRYQPSAPPVELLIGGNGITPSRSWLVPGEGA
jgi:pilus assembly protein CpaB